MSVAPFLFSQIMYTSVVAVSGPVNHDAMMAFQADRDKEFPLSASERSMFDCGKWSPELDENNDPLGEDYAG